MSGVGAAEQRDLSDGFVVRFDEDGDDEWYAWHPDNPHLVLHYNFSDDAEYPLSAIPLDTSDKAPVSLYQQAVMLLSSCDLEHAFLSRDEAAKLGLSPFGEPECEDEDCPF